MTEDHYSVHKNILAKLIHPPSPLFYPFKLGVPFCACTESIFIVVCTQSRRREEDNRRIINVTAYYRVKHLASCTSLVYLSKDAGPCGIIRSEQTHLQYCSESAPCPHDQFQAVSDPLEGAVCGIRPNHEDIEWSILFPQNPLSLISVSLGGSHESHNN